MSEDGVAGDQLLATATVRANLGAVFEPQYRDLEDLYGDELTDDIVLNELGWFIESLVTNEAPDELIERCCDVLEKLCALPSVDPVTAICDEVLVVCSPAVIARLESYLGPLAAALLEEEGVLGEL